MAKLSNIYDTVASLPENQWMRIKFRCDDDGNDEENTVVGYWNGFTDTRGRFEIYTHAGHIYLFSSEILNLAPAPRALAGKHAVERMKDAVRTLRDVHADLSQLRAPIKGEMIHIMDAVSGLERCWENIPTGQQDEKGTNTT